MTFHSAREPESLRYAAILSVLLLAFLGRVLAQIAQVVAPVSQLPSFDRWQSGAVPYPLLLFFQVGILALCTRVIWRLAMGRAQRSSRLGRTLRVAGLVYGGGMLVRLLIGLTIAPTHYWFGAYLPTVFHLVLAGFLLIYGQYHLGHSMAVPRRGVA